MTVAGGTPTLTLNDGGTATYTGGSGSSALTFSYTVGAGQNTAALTATAVNLNAATITDGAGNAANLSLSGLLSDWPADRYDCTRGASHHQRRHQRQQQRYPERHCSGQQHSRSLHRNNRASAPPIRWNYQDVESARLNHGKQQRNLELHDRTDGQWSSNLHGNGY